MGKHEIQTVSGQWLAGDSLADDPVIAADITQRILQAAEKDRLVYVVARAEQPEADLVENGEPQQTAITTVRDFEVLLLVLYAAYALAVVGAAAFVLLEWGLV